MFTKRLFKSISKTVHYEKQKAESEWLNNSYENDLIIPKATFVTLPFLASYLQQ